VTEEFDQDFLHVSEELYGFCFPELWQADYRIQALSHVVHSFSYCRALDE
jgi:hypothetical protein